MDPEHTELKCLYIILFDGVQMVEAAAGLSGMIWIKVLIRLYGSGTH